MAFDSVMAALGVVLLYIGSIFEIADLAAATVASLGVVVVMVEYKQRDAWMVYAVTAAISVMLMPGKYATLAYLLFMGYYPILKGYIDRLRSGIVRWTLKIIIFIAAITADLLISHFILGIPSEAWLIYVAIYLLGVPTLMLYDAAIAKTVPLWLRLRRRIFK